MDCSEFRCGYEIIPKQRKIWNVEIDLLKTFLEVCRLQNIQVQIFAGTLLGAVRHRGFIPWDDDADVCMDRKNFDKLLNLPKDVFPEPYFLQTPYNDQQYYTPFARFRNSNTTGVIKWNNSPNYNNGIYIDVFVLDGKPYNIFEKFQGKLLAYSRGLVALKTNQSSATKSVRSFFAYIICRLMRLNTCIRIHQFLMALSTPFVSRLTLMSHPKSFTDKYWLYKDELTDIVMLDFEGLKVPAPKDYDRILTRMYGDYKKFPPASERGKWHEGIIYFDPDMPYKQAFEKGIIWS